MITLSAAILQRLLLRSKISPRLSHQLLNIRDLQNALFGSLTCLIMSECEHTLSLPRPTDNRIIVSYLIAKDGIVSGTNDNLLTLLFLKYFLHLLWQSMQQPPTGSIRVDTCSARYFKRASPMEEGMKL